MHLMFSGDGRTTRPFEVHVSTYVAHVSLYESGVGDGVCGDVVDPLPEEELLPAGAGVIVLELLDPLPLEELLPAGAGVVVLELLDPLPLEELLPAGAGDVVLDDDDPLPELDEELLLPG